MCCPMPKAVAHWGGVLLNRGLSFLGGCNLCQEGRFSCNEINCHSICLVLGTSIGLPGFSSAAWGSSMQIACDDSIVLY